jgi:hypothetical protein
VREKNSSNAGFSIDKEGDLMLFNNKFHPGHLCFYGGHRSQDGRPQDPSLALASIPLGTKDSILEMFSLTNGAGPGGSSLQRHSLLKWPVCPH